MSGGNGIKNTDINKFFENETNGDLKKISWEFIPLTQ